jgi:hypothetical protein
MSKKRDRARRGAKLPEVARRLKMSRKPRGHCTGAGTHICWSQVKKLQRIRSWTAEKRSLRDDLEKVLVGDLPVNVV